MNDSFSREIERRSNNWKYVIYQEVVERVHI